MGFDRITFSELSLHKEQLWYSIHVKCMDESKVQGHEVKYVHQQLRGRGTVELLFNGYRVSVGDVGNFRGCIMVMYNNVTECTQCH